MAICNRSTQVYACQQAIMAQWGEALRALSCLLNSGAGTAIVFRCIQTKEACRTSAYGYKTMVTLMILVKLSDSQTKQICTNLTTRIHQYVQEIF